MGKNHLRRGRFRLIHLAAIGITGALGVSRVAMAQAMAPTERHPVSLVWEAPAGCPSPAAVSATIEQWLESSPKKASARLVAHARVERLGANEFRVRVTTDDGTTHGERLIHAESCRLAADAAALVIVLAVDPELGGEATPSPPAPVPAAAEAEDPPPTHVPAPPPAAPPPARRDERKPSPRRPEPPEHASSPPEWILGVRGLVGIHQVPGTASGLGALAGLKVQRWRFELGATAWLPRDAALASDPGAGGTFHRYSLEARACFGPVLNTVELSACAGGHAGWLDGEGFGTPNTKRAREYQVGPSVGALAAWRFSKRAAVRADAGISAQLLERHDFVLHRTQFLYRGPPVIGAASLGLEVRF